MLVCRTVGFLKFSTEILKIPKGYSVYPAELYTYKFTETFPRIGTSVLTWFVKMLMLKMYVETAAVV